MSPPSGNPSIINNEVIFFNEEVKGNTVFLSSKNLITRGVEISTPDINEITLHVWKRTVNAIPTNANYIARVGDNKTSVSIQFASLFWFGKSQFDAFSSAVWTAAGQRIYTESVRAIMQNREVRFPYTRMMGSDNLVLSPNGFSARSGGKFIQWEHLSYKIMNGDFHFSSFKSGVKERITYKNVTNNIILDNTIRYFLDNARYRELRAPKE